MMQNEKPSIKERFMKTIQKVKLFPKIWISTLAIFNVAVGFIAGLAVDKQDQQTFEKQPIGFTESGNRPRPKLREDQSSLIRTKCQMMRQMLHLVLVKRIVPRMQIVNRFW